MSNIFYFASILLTCALAGLLAFYAWRHRSVPAARACAGFLLGEALLALVEMLSMLSPTPAQAMFWFKVHYLFLAVTPVFWLLFALEYSGWKYLISKRLRAELFIVPAISQIMLWTNNLHGLWIQHEVVFHKNGPFWIAVIGARVPHIGFLLNSFYGMALLLIGIVLLLLSAWRKARQHRGQLILVAGAASLVLVISYNTLFNLLPKTEFNLFTPGIGLSLLLITLAVLRFQFLRGSPATEIGSAERSQDDHSERTLAGFLLIFVLMAAGISALAYVSYQDYEQRYRRQAESNLSSIVELKVGGLSAWRNERMADAGTLYHNPAFSALAQRYLENPADAQAQAGLRSWLDSFRAYWKYGGIFLLDAHGMGRLSSTNMAEAIFPPLGRETAAILGSGQVTFLDFHRHTADGPIYLATVVPIYAKNDANRPLGVVLFQIDPHSYLYPYLQRWPIASATAETLLVRREGADVLFLNPLKFQADSALTLRIPLKNTTVPAVKAVLGEVGIVEGVDYRGVSVIAFVAPVPGSPWFIVARVEDAEIYAPLRERLLQTAVFFGLLLVASGASLGLVWRHQRTRYYRAQAEAAQALLASEANYRTVVDNVGEGIGRTNSQDQFTFVNPAAEDIFGVPPGGLLGHSLREFVTPEQFELIREETGRRQLGEKSVYEIGIRRPDGEKRHLLVSAVPQFNNQEEFTGTFGVFHDITARKRAEEQIRNYNADLEQRVVERTAELTDLYNNAPCGYHSLDAMGTYIRVNDTELNWLGYTREEILGKIRLPDLLTPASAEIFEKEFPIFKERGRARDLEFDMVRKDGSILPILLSGTVVKDPAGRYLNSRSTITDRTDRKRVEEVMQKSQAKLETVNKELESFAYSVSHDLRSPLRAIDGFSRIIVENYSAQMDGEGIRLLNVVRSNVQKMDELISELLELSRIARSEVRFSRIDMTALAQSVFSEIASRQVQETFAFSVAPLPDASGDFTLLRQVWRNLISNAIKYTLHKANPRIEICSRTENGMNVYFVKDNGVGYNPQYSHKLFGVFQRLHKTEEFEGTGVGLAIVQRIVLRHGGRVWAEGQVNQGATFYFALPQ